MVRTYIHITKIFTEIETSSIENLATNFTESFQDTTHSMDSVNCINTTFYSATDKAK